MHRAPDAVCNVIASAEFYSCSANAVIRVYAATGDLVDTHKHMGDLKE